MKLVNVTEMRAIEAEANSNGLSYDRMMENAGLALAEIVDLRFKSIEKKNLVGIVGSGNNGGDTLVALAELQKRGWNSVAILYKDREQDPLLVRLLDQGGKSYQSNEGGISIEARKAIHNSTLLLDGLFGTGIKLPIREDGKKFLAVINRILEKQIVIAVDCPSGVDCDSGEVSPETILAQLTVCMEAVKVGLVKQPAFKYCGELITVPIGLPKMLSSNKVKDTIVDADWVSQNFPKRPAEGHKGTFGTVVVVGGCTNYVGAPMLTGLAAYRTGSGLVTLAVPQPVQAALAGSVPEFTWLVLDDASGVISETASDLLKQKIGQVDCLVVGPGIGREETTSRFLERFLFKQMRNGNNRKIGFLSEFPQDKKEALKFPPVVIDADALRWLAEQEDWQKFNHLHMVLSPHPGEMSALTGLTIEEVQGNRIECARSFAQEWQQVVVLKGALTVIAAPDGRICLIPIMSSALAKAGSGDVLSGIIASLIGQGMHLFEAASVAAWIHAQSGLFAARSLGSDASVLARDIISAISTILKYIYKNTA